MHSVLPDFLEKNLTGSEPSFIKTLKWTYDTCMDMESIEESDDEPLRDILQSLGGWPVVEGSKWKEWNFDWIDTLKAFRELGYSHDILLSLTVGVDERNSTVHTIIIDDPSLGVTDRSYLINGINDSITSSYIERMVVSAMLLGVDRTTATSELMEVLKFETALANFTLPSEERRNISKLYHKYTIKRLQQEVPQIPWLKYINNLLNDKVYENETLTVRVPDFLHKLADLITSTDKRVVANYMLWRIVHQSASLLSIDWRSLPLENFLSRRFDYCLESLKDNFAVALGSYYVKHHFRDENKYTVLEYVKYVHNEFLKMLEEIDWMDEQTKKYAKEKAKDLKVYTGYPKELLNDTAVLEYYKNLKITSKSYFVNIRRLSKWSNDNSISKLRKPNVKGEWTGRAETVTMANAMASYQGNSIEFTAALLQKPFYSQDRPRYINFGTIGYLAGHEITHVFDDKGIQYDKDGNLANWWDETSDKLFKKKAKCILDLSSNHTESGLNINAMNTQGENIADFGGVKEAYRAYQSWVKDHGEEQLLPGLKFTQNQMFWISNARISCEQLDPDERKEYMIIDEHSPGRFRVNGPMSNLPEFAKDFNCPPDSPMNKKERCQVW